MTSTLTHSATGGSVFSTPSPFPFPAPVLKVSKELITNHVQLVEGASCCRVSQAICDIAGKFHFRPPTCYAQELD